MPGPIIEPPYSRYPRCVECGRVLPGDAECRGHPDADTTPGTEDAPAVLYPDADPTTDDNG